MGRVHVRLLHWSHRLRVKTQNLYRSFKAHSAFVPLQSASSKSILTDFSGCPCTPPPLWCHYHGATMDGATTFLEFPVGSCRSDSLGDACRWVMGKGGADSYLCSALGLDAADSPSHRCQVGDTRPDDSPMHLSILKKRKRRAVR